ncbi:unnamed protein product [Thlaspi arvense]|uniref:AB hydrolase-1 domain-containing protein n=1 Tax=Thlaspi arvense TaxID=13288 RepID=A0AAU9RSB1_THLAR|nr:unnamed protein product [Thlaspi arvense]
MASKRVNLGFPSMAASASSSASVSGSGADIQVDDFILMLAILSADDRFCKNTRNLEQLLGAKPKPKRKKIAGIDQDELLDPALLADPDSCFCHFNGVHIHHKVSSVFSWHRVMKPLAQVSGSKVLAFDRPAFGLTSRPNLSEHSSPNSLAAEKAVLVGTQRVAALVLVAPAILAPAKSNIGGKQFQTDVQMQEESTSPNTNGNLFTRISNILSNFSKYIVQAVMRLMKGMGEMLSSLYKKALSAFLRSAFAVTLIRMVIDKFGIAAVRNAWFDSNQVTEHVLNGYTKPLRTKGWDKALAEYTAEILADISSGSKPPLEKRLHEISCPVLIITGDSDRLVPSWNSERLSRAIPGSRLEVIKNCGHLPQEEKPKEFISLVQKFLLGVFGGSQEQFVQAAATT